MNNQILHALLRSDFSSFINKVFATINPGTEYENNWHIDLIADYLSAVERGTIKRLIINMPPRALKSVCASVAWPSWILGHSPTKRIMIASYTQSLSVKHSLDTRLVLNSEWYQALFPSTRISKKHNLKSKFMTTKHGFRMATSVGSMITGEGGDILVIDDPHNPSHIHSKTRRKSVIDWYEQTFATRLNNKATGAIVLVMQRLHEEDLAGHLLATDINGWTLLKIPIISKQNISYKIENNIYSYKEGEILQETRYNEELIDKITQEMGSINFAAQYLQEPISTTHSILQNTDLVFYENFDQLPDYTVQSWDTAIKTSDTSDYSVCTTWGVIENSYYLLNMLRAKLSYPELKSKILSMNNRFKSRFILIEDHGSGQSIIQDLRAEGVHILVPIKQKFDKITRFASVVPLFQSGCVKLPKSTSWINTLVQELVTFPNTKHDDIVDSVSQFLRYIKNTKKLDHHIRIRTL
jgi:predicted phage terminase large subunit-like protein